MHVAHFLHRYPPALGGAEAYFERLGRSLVEQGDAVTVWTTTAVDLRAFWSQGFLEVEPTIPGVAEPGQPPQVRRYRPHRWPGRRYMLKLLSLLPIASWQCRTLPCNPFAPAMARDAVNYDGPLDAVHASAFPFTFPILCGLRLARRRGVPFYLTPFLHLGDPDDPRDPTRRQYTSRPMRWLLTQADAVFVQTQQERAAVVAMGVPESRVVLQGLGVEPRECTGGDRITARQAWGLAPDEFIVGHLANASVEKGTVDLLRAASMAWAKGHRFRVLLAGPVMTNFERFWNGFLPQDRVIRLGEIRDDQKQDFFAAIDLFALPSRTDSFGLVLLEAWANGKPNLVYRAGGPGELVRDGVDGVRVPCGDLPRLAEELSRLAGDPEGCHRLGRQGLARIDEFRWAEKLAIVRERMMRT